MFDILGFVLCIQIFRPSVRPPASVRPEDKINIQVRKNLQVLNQKNVITPVNIDETSQQKFSTDEIH